MPRCPVRQESDEIVCSCGLRWDVNDPEPPSCVKRVGGNYVTNPRGGKWFIRPANVQVAFTPNDERITVTHDEIEAGYTLAEQGLLAIIRDVTGGDSDLDNYYRETLLEIARRAYAKGKASV